MSAPGMDLRDWFAGQALNGLLSDKSSRLTFVDVARDEKYSAHDVAASVAYAHADAMMAERKKADSALLPSETVTDAWIDRWWPDMATPEGRAEIRLQLDTLLAKVAK